MDITALLVLTAFAAWATTVFHPRPLISMCMFFLLPSLYLFLRRGHLNALKIFATSIITGIAAGALDAAITANHGWWVPEGQLIFPQRFFGIWNIDNTLWYMGLIFYMVAFYEYFLDPYKHRHLSKRFRYFLLFPIVISAVVIVLAAVFPDTLSHVRYAYLTLALPFIVLPFILLLSLGRKKIPALLGRFSLLSLFFFFVNLTHEITALQNNQWIFPGEYIGTVHLAGVVIPIEEFLLYIVLSGFAGLAYYEVFVDDTF